MQKVRAGGQPEGSPISISKTQPFNVEIPIPTRISKQKTVQRSSETPKQLRFRQPSGNPSSGNDDFNDEIGNLIRSKSMYNYCLIILIGNQDNITTNE